MSASPSPSANEALSEFIWRTRYRDPAGRPAESTLADSLGRVARAVAAAEADSERWRRHFFAVLSGLGFLPAGRILAGAGVGREVTLFNCFVMGLIEDSIPGIFEALKEGAITMQHGGGVGYDFSTLRPRGTHARASGTIASGPVSFMHVWDAMCATVLSTGARRGAMMATLRCDHPDIEEFIEAKRNPDSLRHFNLSVLVSDAFMSAVQADEPWPLLYPLNPAETHTDGAIAERRWTGYDRPLACRIWKTVRARELWAQLGRCAQESAEPGVLYIDRINAANNLGYIENLSSTNPCGEAPLPPYGACNLGSINLPVFVRDPFSSAARLDLAGIAATVGTAVRFLDDVIEISRLPLERQRIEVRRSRRIGMGITGLADALLMLGQRYDSAAGRETAAAAMRTIRDAAYLASIELARERGPCPAFSAQAYGERPFVRSLPEGIRSAIARTGLRNSHLLAVAPAGTISLLAGNVSSGIEPIFRERTLRRILDSNGQYRDFEALDHACATWRARFANRGPLPPAYVDAGDVGTHDQLLMQAALQPFIDGSISKTVLLAPQAPPGSARSVFESAYTLGLKGCTVYQASARAGVVQELSLEAAAVADNCHCRDSSREAD